MPQPRAVPALCRLVLCLSLMALPSVALAAPSPEAPAAALIAHGFENVVVQDEEGKVGVWFENRMYRHELTALGVAAFLAGSRMDPETVLELIPENRGVPMLSLSAPAGDWLRLLRGEIDGAAFREILMIRVGTRADGSSLSRPAAENSSYWRTDLAVRPLFDFQLGQGTDVFLYTLRIAPEATMTPFRGGIATLQAGIRLHDDRDPCGPDNPCGRSVTPIRNTLSWGTWLPGQWLGTASGGLFPGDRYGVQAQVGRLFLDGHLEVYAGGEATGEILFLKDVVEYSNIGQWAAYGAATVRTSNLDLEGTVEVGRYREKELGVRVELARRLHEFEVGFFGVANQYDEVAGVNLRIPLPLRKDAKPSRVRLATVPAFPFTYRESVASVGIRTSFYDDLDRFRKRLYPTYIRNNLEDLRLAERYVDLGE